MNKFVNHRSYLHIPVEKWDDFDIRFIQYRGIKQMVPILGPGKVTSNGLGMTINPTITAHTMEELAKDFQQFLVLK